MEKKDNHYVPKCLLKRWLVDQEELKGLYVLDIKTKEINYHINKRKKAFPFASFDNLYILTKDKERLLNLENWFEGLENSLSLFIDKVSRKEKQIFKNLGHLNKLMMGLISFQFRSRYFFEISIDYLTKNSELLKGYDAFPFLQILLARHNA
jgi:hypothetical protein